MIEINGIKYTEREIPSPKKRSSSAINELLMMYGLAYQLMSIGGNSGSKTSKMPGECSVDIVKEFALIQQKKSTLSRSQRDYVVFRFNKTFIPISEDEQK